jgi:hypothetical protein
MGYDYIALGGLARAQSKEILTILKSLQPHLTSQTRMHLFGVGRIYATPAFRHLGVTSFDSASPLRSAWLDSNANYHTRRGETYAAVRIPKVEGSGIRIKRILAAGISDQETLKKFIDSGVFETQEQPWYYQLNCEIKNHQWVRELRLARESHLRQKIQAYLARCDLFCPDYVFAPDILGESLLSLYLARLSWEEYRSKPRAYQLIGVVQIEGFMAKGLLRKNALFTNGRHNSNTLKTHLENFNQEVSSLSDKLKICHSFTDRILHDAVDINAYSNQGQGHQILADIFNDYHNYLITNQLMNFTLLEQEILNHFVKILMQH